MYPLVDGSVKASSALSIYLSMKSGEIQTNEIIADALMNRKRVFIPKITGAESHNMVMVEIFSTEEVESFPKSKWGIPEPQLSENFIDVKHMFMHIIVASMHNTHYF